MIKTPQEIAVQLVEDSYGEYGFLGDQPFAEMIAKALTDYAATIRMEGLRKAEHIATLHICGQCNHAGWTCAQAIERDINALWEYAE